MPSRTICVGLCYIAALIERKYIRSRTATKDGPGRPPEAYEVNPELLAACTQNTQNPAPEGNSVDFVYMGQGTERESGGV